jgi:hypothetical protein
MMEVLLDRDLSPVMDHLQDRQDYTEEIDNEILYAQREMTADQEVTLKAFLLWIKDKQANGPLTIVTTNYDVSVETPLFAEVGVSRVPAAIDFGFDWRDPSTGTLHPRPTKPSVAFFKLHGSLNWLRCDLCGQLYVNPLEAIAYLSFSDRQAWANTCECGWWPLRHLIVAPSTVRDVRDTHLLNVWRSATEALRTAREWFIVGYSLPDEDLAIRSMLLRAFAAQGLQSSTEPLGKRAGRPGPSVTVVQLGEAARPKYAAMFQRFQYLGGGLDEWLGSRAARV